MPYPITRKGRQHCVNGKCYSSRADARKYQKALYAHIKDVQPMVSMMKEYITAPHDGKIGVFKKDASGNPYGPNLGTHETEQAAKQQIEGMLAVQAGDKDSPYYQSYHRRLEPDDPRVNYDAMGGRSGNEACANCYWFNPAGANCEVVWGDIVASGVSDMWLAKKVEPTPAMTPMPVYIVNEDAAGMGGDMEDMGDKSTAVETKARLLDRVLTALGIKTAPAAQPAPDWLFAGFKQDEAGNWLGPVEGFKIDPDGRWIGWWSNNAKDKAGEYFAAKATDAYLDRVESGAVPYPELWYKHIPTLRMGKADHLARIGYLTFGTGTFYDNEIGQKGKAYLAAEQAAGNTKTMSHGYLYPQNMKQGGVYGAYNTFELTVLDPGEECNPYTDFEVNTMATFNKLDQKGLDRIKAIFGEEQAAKLINFGETKSLELEKQGVDLKAFQNYSNQTVEDSKAQEGLKALADATLAGFAGLGEKLETLTGKIDAVETSRKETADALESLKAFVATEFGYTPRASKSNNAAAAANPTQVDMLKTANAEAGKKDGTEDPTEDLGTKSIFDYALAGAGVKPTL